VNRVPADHLCGKSTGFLKLGDLRRDLAPFYSPMGRPSIDAELMIRILVVGYCSGGRQLDAEAGQDFPGLFQVEITASQWSSG
jgi:hypothetical protein